MLMLLRIEQLLLRLSHRDVRYWTTACIVFFLAVTGSSYVYDYLNLTNVRSQFFQQLLEWGPRPPEPKFVRVVLIGDKEYWFGELAGRRPIKRQYLAKLVEKLALANVHVIALDFDVRVPNPDTADIPEDYQEETSVLIRAIESAAFDFGKKVVLATPIWFDEHGAYRLDWDIYQAHGLCNGALEPSRTKHRRPELEQAVTSNVSCGYIALPYDPLAIPGQLEIAGGVKLDSFALAVARAHQPELVSRLLERAGTRERYSGYISDDKFRSSQAQFSAQEVLDGTVNKRQLEARAVIVGGNWSTFAANRGDPVDLHWTPAGLIVGAAMHANFAEAILDSRLFGAVPSWLVRATEIAFSLVAAVIFACTFSIWWKVVTILSLFLTLIVVQWIVLHGFGVFFDAFVPVLGLGLHSLYERLVAPHEARSAGRKMRAE